MTAVSTRRVEARLRLRESTLWQRWPIEVTIDVDVDGDLVEVSIETGMSEWVLTFTRASAACLASAIAHASDRDTSR